MKRWLVGPLLIAAACGDCSGPDPEMQRPADPPSAEPSDPDDPATTDARQQLIAAFRATRARSYRTTTTMTRRSGAPPLVSEWTTELAPPDRRRAIMKQPGGGESQVLTIGRRVWRREGTTWTPAPRNPGASTEMEERLIHAIEAGSVRAERLGGDRILGRAVSVYAVTWTAEASGGGATPGVDGRVWIGDDGLAYRMEMRVPAPLDALLETVYEYDDTIRIEPP